MRKKEKLEFLPVKYFDDNNIVISPGKKKQKTRTIRVFHCQNEVVMSQEKSHYLSNT